MVFEPMCGGRLEGPGTFDDTLARHVSSEAACTMRAPFALGDADDLRELIRAADFGEIAIRPVTGAVRFPSATRFVQDQVAGSPLAGLLGRGTGGTGPRHR